MIVDVYIARVVMAMIYTLNDYSSILILCNNRLIINMVHILWSGKPKIVIDNNMKEVQRKVRKIQAPSTPRSCISCIAYEHDINMILSNLGRYIVVCSNPIGRRFLGRPVLK